MAAGRTSIAALGVLMVVEVIHLFLAIGYYEDRITVVTHGLPDVWPAAFAYALSDHVVDELGHVSGLAVEANTVSGLIWLTSMTVAVTAVAMWLRRVPVRPRWDKATLGWLTGAVVLKVVSAVYNTVAAPPGPSVGGVLATRPVAYSLWMVSTVVLVVAAWRLMRTIQRTTR
ncbi:hypothetical protein AB0G04_11565 [Actinoplanes sp. NPDC023801]|uniref:hypothetical protein n=1 Tax=Actinoplanes sp. NPDC023801 TaxID=3154595 RepID=UPI0033D4E351